MLCHALNVSFQIPNSNFGENQPSSLGCYFWRDIVLFSELVFFLCFRPNSYTRMCVSTIGSFSLFGKTLEHHGKTLVESWFCGHSLILDVFVYFDYSSRITFWGWGTTSRSSRCKGRDMYLGGVGDHFQVLEVSEGTCTVLRTHLPTICSLYVHMHIHNT